MTPGHRRLATVAVTVLVFVLLFFLGTTVRVPYVALGPGPTVNTLGSYDGKSVVDVSGAPVDPTTGNLNLTTVSVTDGLSLFQAISMWFSGDYSLTPRDRIYPPGKSDEEVRQGNQQEMSGSEDNATAAALTHLDRPTKLIVAEVAADGPAGEVLKKDDVILGIDGQPASTTEQVQTVVRGKKPGDVVSIEIRRGEATQTVQVTLGARPDDKNAGYLGVTPAVVNADPNLKIDYNVGDIGGPSAGLMLTLAVIDKLSPGELTHGKFIAGTGTIDPSGTVGPIGGITHKTQAAREAGATVFLVPEANCTEAKDDAPDGLDLVKVTDLDSALSSLEAIGAGQDAPHC